MDYTETPSKVSIYESELDYVARCVMDFPHTETGGDFFGLWTKDGHPCIQFVIGPGEATTQTESSFFQDISYLRECGFLLNDRFGLEHIGAWHSHHQLDLCDPSPGDINTMRKAMQQTDFSRFIISICNIDQEEVAAHGFLFSRDNLHHYTTCNWHILQGLSPIRERLEKNKEQLLDLFTEPETVTASWYVVNSEAQAEEMVVEKEIIEKPELAKNSYWKKPEGQEYLKNVYQKMNTRKDLSDVELVQLTDKRIAIAFRHSGKDYEIRFPDKFPRQEPEIVEKVNVNDVLKVILRPAKKQKSGLRKFLNTINIFGNNNE